MSDYSTAWDTLIHAIAKAQGASSGSIAEIDHLTIDQQLQVAQVAALLSISQELSRIHHEGINPTYSGD